MTKAEPVGGPRSPGLTKGAALQVLQAYVAQMEVERGFSDQTALEKCLLLGEELGELFKAVRGATGIAMDATSPPLEVADELADLLIYICAIANRFGVDLDRALRNKEARNRARVWRSRATAPRSSPAESPPAISMEVAAAITLDPA
ncbi:MAG: hypothetical protein ACK5PF_02490, partial [bacterium]